MFVSPVKVTVSPASTVPEPVISGMLVVPIGKPAVVDVYDVPVPEPLSRFGEASELSGLSKRFFREAIRFAYRLL
jgi:hypothetical protein